MFSTGKIGLWSIIEEGIGIFAGSLPALRPLLSLSIFSGSSIGKSGNSESGDKYNKPRTRNQGRSDIKMDTFHELRYNDGDGDSQKHILKETHVTMMTNERSTGAIPGDWERSQVLGWKNKTEV
jgi:hypothetical protein